MNQIPAHLLIHRILGIHKTLQLERIRHHFHFPSCR
jgi:hypothetical protein